MEARKEKAHEPMALELLSSLDSITTRLKTIQDQSRSIRSRIVGSDPEPSDSPSDEDTPSVFFAITRSYVSKMNNIINDIQIQLERVDDETRFE